MAGYGQFCPVAKAMELLDERWTALVLRELLMGSERFKAFGVLTKISEIGKAQRPQVFRTFGWIQRTDRDQLLRVRERQGLKEYRVNDAKDRSVGTDSERKRNYGNRREYRPLGQHSKRVAQIPRQHRWGWDNTARARRAARTAVR